MSDAKTETSAPPATGPGRLAGYASLCLLVAFVCAVIVTAGATKWVPAGRAGVDHIVIPVVAFPIIWVVFAVPLYASTRQRRAWAVVLGVTALHAALIVLGFVL